MKIKQWQKEVDQWIQIHGVRYFDPLTNVAILMEEVGEFARHMSRQFGEQSYKNPPDSEKQKTMLEEELGDVLFVLSCLANQLDINLEEVLKENLEKKSQRDSTRHIDNPKLR